MHIPVFCYHNAIAEQLERDLAFLVDNDYRTLTAGEVVDALTGAAEPPDKAVALTFDDGLLSLRTEGLPLLERFDARATVFAITGLTPEGATEPRGDGDLFRLMGWDDLAFLRDSGRIEIGSHGHRHNPVHVEATDGPPIRVADYDRLYDAPVPYTEACDAAAIRAFDGTPSRPAKHLLAASRVLVAGHAGGRSAGSRNALETGNGAADGSAPASGDLKLVDAAPLIEKDLRRSAEALRDRLGIERLHLCLPQGDADESLPERARAAGFESVFWSRREGRTENRPGDDPYRIVRTKHDFVRRLPGRGRRSAASVVLTKVKRRLTSDPWV